jgi:xanthine dehydrogenase small subunit
MAAAFEVNGQSVIVNDVDPHCTLLQWLRASGRTGTKEGCAEGECGACAVAFVSRDAEGRTIYEPVNSCLVSLPEVHGRSLISVEGVRGEGGALHPVQQALVESGGSQCGYCTPGFVMSLFCEYYRPGRTGYDPEAISGNLCRCTGYRPIIEAARGLGPPLPQDPWLLRLAAAAPEMTELEHAAPGCRFLRPRHLSELLQVLSEHPDAVLLAGGTDLMVYVNQRHARHTLWVSLSAVSELRRFQVKSDEIVLGAGLALSHLEARLADGREGQAGLGQEAQGGLGREARLLSELLPLFSSRLIRNRATLGGNLATASPIGDAAPVLLALEAVLTVASTAGERRLPLKEFFTGYRKTSLRPGELIVSVHLPRPLPRLQRFYKVSKRVLDDISTISAAFALDLAKNGTVERLRIAYGGIAETPIRPEAIERLATGKPWNLETLGLLLRAGRTLGTPLSDQRGSAAYRQAMTLKLLERFYAEADSSGQVPAAEAAP